MKYKICADIHKFSVIEKEISWEDFKDCDVFLGDNIDIKNAKDRDEESLYLLDLRKWLFSKNKIYINGNHEQVSDQNDFKIADNVLFCHGHQFDPLMKYESKKKTPDFLIKLTDWFNRHREIKLSEKILLDASEWAKENYCHTICFGHYHPNKLIDLKYNGVRIVCVPRGITEIEL